MQMLGARSLKELVPEMVCSRFVPWMYTDMMTELLFVLQVEKVDWQPLNAKL
jgi:hypothetical protein